jgi:hypothetical protein
MNTDIKLHPKLQIAVDRINKRYADITVSRHVTRHCSVNGERVELIVRLDLKHETSPHVFATLHVTETDSPLDDHKFGVESRLVRNERRPKNIKTTTKEKLIPKLIDSFCRPFTLEERSRELLAEAHDRLANKRWELERVEQKAREAVWTACYDPMIKSVMGEAIVWGDKHRELVVAHQEAYAKAAWIKDNLKSKGAAVQIIAFQVGEKWVINIYNSKPTEDGKTNNRVENYDSFDDLPDFIQQKVALLRIAPHNEVLEDIGVKVEANSYFLYGQELQQLRGTDDTGEESKAEGNETA